MYLLLNTCAAQATVALASSSGIVAEESLPARSTSESLLPAIRRVLSETAVASLRAIAVVTGPGSFTGIRAGLAAAKGLAESHSIPIVALSRLDLISTTQTAILDAGRGEFYLGGNLPETLVSQLPNVPLVTTDPALAAILPNTTLVAEPAGPAILAALLERVAQNRYDDPALTDANYLRRADAELKQQAAASLDATL